jgi:hypothetical protein
MQRGTTLASRALSPPSEAIPRLMHNMPIVARPVVRVRRMAEAAPRRLAAVRRKRELRIF